MATSARTLVLCFVAAALASFNLRHMPTLGSRQAAAPPPPHATPSLRRSPNPPCLGAPCDRSTCTGDTGGGPGGLGAAASTAAAQDWALPPGPASLAGRRLPILFLAMGGEAYKDFMLNWAASVHAIQVRRLQAASAAPPARKHQTRYSA
jgi:hypothetical protein